MDTLLAVDPGIHGCGCALFHAGWLMRCWHTGLRYQYTEPSTVVLARLAAEDARNMAGDVTEIAVEWPQAYVGGKNPNHLLGLTAVSGALAVLYRDANFAAYLPREWKGQLPKEVCHERVLKRLSSEELRCLEALPKNKRQAGDVLDAIGIGLHHLGRGVRCGT